MDRWLEIRVGCVTRVLVGVLALLALAHLSGQYARYFLGYSYLKGLVPLFDLNAERNIPTYFSLLMLVFAAQLLALLAVLTHKAGGAHVSKWLILSAGFLVMGFDEGFSVHERLTRWVRPELGSDKVGVFYYAWVIPALALTAFLSLFFLKFLRDLPAATRWRFVVAGGIYLGGAIGVEMLGGWYFEESNLPKGVYDFNYSLMVIAEECFGEMAGMVLFIRALLLHCAEHHPDVRLLFRCSGTEAARLA